MTYILLTIIAVASLIVMRHCDGEVWFASAGVLLVDVSFIGFAVIGNIISVL